MCLRELEPGWRSRLVEAKAAQTRVEINEMTKLTPAIITTLCVFLAACASTDSAPDSASGDECFRIRNVNSWDAIDDKHIYIKEAVNDHYLLTMFSACHGIKFAQAIALSNTMGRICPNDFGRITYRDGSMRSSCRIDDVERVGNKDEAVSLVESRSEDVKD